MKEVEILLRELKNSDKDNFGGEEATTMRQMEVLSLLPVSLCFPHPPL